MACKGYEVIKIPLKRLCYLCYSQGYYKKTKVALLWCEARGERFSARQFSRKIRHKDSPGKIHQERFTRKINH